MVDCFTQPTNGTVASNADDTLRYTPDSGFTGSDSFTYTASDGSSTTTASVSLQVAAAERVVLRGTRSSNVLDVSSELQPYEIYALKGNDRVVGTAFDDLIDGGTGHDDLFGGAGNDTFTVSGSTNGDDLFDGGDGHDVVVGSDGDDRIHMRRLRSEEHTSELQSLMRISYAVFCLKKKKQ